MNDHDILAALPALCSGCSLRSLEGVARTLIRHAARSTPVSSCFPFRIRFRLSD